MWCWHWASAITGHEVNHIQSRCQMLASPSGWSRRRRNGSGINSQRTQRFLHQQTVHRARLAQRILFQHNFEIPVDLRLWWGLQEYATRSGRTVLHWRCQRPERSCFCNFKSHHSGLRTAHLSISISSDDLKEGCFPVSAGLRGFFIRYFFYAASFKSFRKHGRTVPSKGAPCCTMFEPIFLRWCWRRTPKTQRSWKTWLPWWGVMSRDSVDRNSACEKKIKKKGICIKHQDLENPSSPRAPPMGSPWVLKLDLCSLDLWIYEFLLPYMFFMSFMCFKASETL